MNYGAEHGCPLPRPLSQRARGENGIRATESPAPAIRSMAGQLTDLGMGKSVWGDCAQGKS